MMLPNVGPEGLATTVGVPVNKMPARKRRANETPAYSTSLANFILVCGSVV
jgi:hypothetical protein